MTGREIAWVLICGTPNLRATAAGQRAKFVPCVKMQSIRWSPPTLGARNGLCKSLCLGSINGRSTGGNLQTYGGTAHRDSNRTSNQAGERLDLIRY